MNTAKKKIVVIGGGTGTYNLLQGLKAYADTIAITAIVTMADSGGSTGRLRDEFGQLPVGDVRMALAALATDVDAQADVLRELFLYRFAKGEGLVGHNFGNLLLTALTEIMGDTSKAIETAAQILRVHGSVIPVTTDNVQLVARYNSGALIVGEHSIDEPGPQAHFDRIATLEVAPEATINPKARQAILEADLIVLGPGDLYTSLLANCVVGGMPEAIRESTAPLLFVCNLMSRSGQTIGMNSEDYLDELEAYVGIRPNMMLANNARFSQELLEKYTLDGNHAVEIVTIDPRCEVIATDLVSSEAYVTPAGDTLKRSLIRHDGAKLAEKIMELIKRT